MGREISTVAAAEFGRHPQKYAAKAKKHGPLGVTKDTEVIAVLLSPEDFEQLAADSTKKVLQARMLETETVANELVHRDISQRLKRRLKKS